MKYWETPTGKIVSTFIHDHSNAICLIGANLRFIKQNIYEKLSDEDKKEFDECYTNIKESITKARSSTDKLYTELKTLNGY